MALLGFEGFDGVASATDLLLGPFNVLLGGTNPTVTTSNARTGTGNCIGLNGASAPGMQLLRATGTSAASVIVGAALITTNGSSFIGVYNGAVCQASFACSTAGVMTVYRGLPSSGTLLATASTLVIASVYNYFELLVSVGSGTSGALTARVNGSTVLNLGSLNTSFDGTTIVNQVGVGSTYTGTGNCGYLDDFYFVDLTGAPPYNTFLGDVHVNTLLPSGNGNVQWTPSAGANWQAVSDAAMDSDGSYTTSVVPGQVDLFNTPGLAATPTTIYGVQIKLATRSEGAGSDTIAGVVTSNNTQQVGAPQTVLSNYTYVDNVFVNDPSTNAAWTKTGVNAAQFGYKRIT